MIRVGPAGGGGDQPSNADVASWPQVQGACEAAGAQPQGSPRDRRVSPRLHRREPEVGWQPAVHGGPELED